MRDAAQAATDAPRTDELLAKLRESASGYLTKPLRTEAEVRRIRALARQMVRLDDVPIREAIEIAGAQVRSDARWYAEQDHVNDYDFMLGPDGRFAE